MAIQKFVYNELQVKINDAESHYYKNNYSRQLFYENDFLCYINTLGIEGTYLDIGTNIGNHLVYLGLFTSAEKIYGFEPINIYKNIAEQNINLNQLQGFVQVQSEALSDRQIQTAIQIDGVSQNVQTIPLDKLQISKEKIDLIKIDVEGMEINVLKGAVDVLKNSRPLLFVEVIQEIDSQNYDGSEIIQFLETLDYTFTGKAFNHQPTLEFIPKENLPYYSLNNQSYPCDITEYKTSDETAFVTKSDGGIFLNNPESKGVWYSKSLADFNVCQENEDMKIGDFKALFLDVEAYAKSGGKFYIAINLYKRGKCYNKIKEYINRRKFIKLPLHKKPDTLRIFIYSEDECINIKRISLTAIHNV